ncbi:MAG: polysaccharide biosynthesis protein [Gammaproteobacteria bacterium]|nr:polysaccharide biosynthesis protein [Gammaproteobacteria bacterium]
MKIKIINRRIAVIFHDLCMVVIAWTAAIMILYNFQADEFSRLGNILLHVLPGVVGVQSVLFWHYGLYRGIWRFASLPDLWNIFRSVIIGTLAISLFLILFGIEGIPRASLLIYPSFLMFLLGAPRLFYRGWREHSFNFLLERQADQRVLILGAGWAGMMLARDMLRNRDYLPIGFLDDKVRLHGGRVHGIPVLGHISALPETVRKLKVELVVIAMPSASDEQMQRAVDYCERSQVLFRTLPKLQDMVNHQASLKEVRNVSIDDLLGRDKIQLHWDAIENGLSGKVVMVSGGGGSIGSELCRQIARLKPKALVILERCEFNLYQTDMVLQREYPETVRYNYLGDVCDKGTIEHIMTACRPEVIFHAAAYKHVPMLQSQVRETARNNIIGTKILAETAVSQGCRSFVLISTDKAVNPTNIMGASKRVAEIFCQAMDTRSNTRFITVRFGNVLGSAGSVVPLFKEQIAQGGPVTVTHPDITRYFMTIPEACQLILQAGAMGYGGEIFVLDMGRPVKIKYLAEQLIRLSGKVPGHDIKIDFTGLRAGEKLHEELFHWAEETRSRTQHDKILLASSRITDDWRELTARLAELSAACDAYDEKQITHLLKVLVPEFVV